MPMFLLFSGLNCQEPEQSLRLVANAATVIKHSTEISNLTFIVSPFLQRFNCACGRARHGVDRHFKEAPVAIAIRRRVGACSLLSGCYLGLHHCFPFGLLSPSTYRASRQVSASDKLRN